MADNVQTETVVTPGLVFATDDIAGVHHPKTKMEWGPSDTATQVDTGASALPIQDGGNTITIDATALPLPTGAATAAAQLPDGHNVTVDNAAGAAAVNIQDGGNSITIDGTVTANAGTGAFTVEQSIAANLKTQVAGTKSNNGGAPGLANLGTLPAVATAAAPTYTEGNQVGLSTDLSGNLRTAGGAGGTQYTEDAVAATDPVGTQPVMTRRDTPTALVSANLDVVSQQATNFGAAYVQVVTSGGAFVDTFGGSGGTAQADESAFTEGTTNFTPIGGVLNDTITSDPVEDQAAAARITAKRALHVNLRNVAGTEIGTTTAPVGVKIIGATSLLGVDSDSQQAASTAIGLFVRRVGDIDDNTAFVDGTTQVTPAGFIFDEVAGPALTENDVAAARIDSKRALVGVIEDATTRGTRASVLAADPAISANGLSVRNIPAVYNRTASGTLGALNATVVINSEGAGLVHWEIDTGTLVGTVVFEATLDDTNWFAINAIRINGTIIASTASFADRGALDTAGYSQVRLRVSAFTSGTSNARLEGSFGGGLARLSQALPAGTNNIGDVDIASGPTGSSALQQQGTAAHDAATVGNPLLAGAQMETMADSAPGTRAGTDGDANKLATTDGALFVITTGPQAWSYHENSSSALTDASVHAAPGAGLSLYVTSIVFSTGAATAWNIFFEEGATTVLGPWYLEAVAGRGATIHFSTPKKITANTALTVTTSAAIAHSIDVQGFIAPG